MLRRNESETAFSVNNKKITGVADPQSLFDGVNLNYLKKNTIILNNNNSFDAGNKIICNVKNAQNGDDCMNLNSCKKLVNDTVKNSLNTVVILDNKQNKVSFKNKRLSNIGPPVDADDCVTVRSLPATIFVDKYNKYNGGGRVITNVAAAIHDTDVVTFGFLKKYLQIQ